MTVELKLEEGDEEEKGMRKRKRRRSQK